MPGGVGQAGPAGRRAGPHRDHGLQVLVAAHAAGNRGQIVDGRAYPHFRGGGARQHKRAEQRADRYYSLKHDVPL